MSLSLLFKHQNSGKARFFLFFFSNHLWHLLYIFTLSGLLLCFYCKINSFCPTAPLKPNATHCNGVRWVFVRWHPELSGRWSILRHSCISEFWIKKCFLPGDSREVRAQPGPRWSEGSGLETCASDWGSWVTERPVWWQSRTSPDDFDLVCEQWKEGILCAWWQVKARTCCSSAFGPQRGRLSARHLHSHLGPGCWRTGKPLQE